MGCPLYVLCFPLTTVRERSIRIEQPCIVLSFSYNYRHSKVVCSSVKMCSGKDSFDL